MTAATEGYAAMAAEARHGDLGVRIAMLLNLRRRTMALATFAEDYDEKIADDLAPARARIDCALKALLLERELRNEHELQTERAQ